MLLGHRCYDVSIGRFISRDPAYAGTNYYAYGENNPLGGTDPSGLDGATASMLAAAAATTWELPGLGEVVVGVGLLYEAWELTGKLADYLHTKRCKAIY